MEALSNDGFISLLSGHVPYKDFSDKKTLHVKFDPVVACSFLTCVCVCGR